MDPELIYFLSHYSKFSVNSFVNQTVLSVSLPLIVPKSFSLNALNHHLLRDMIMDD